VHGSAMFLREINVASSGTLTMWSSSTLTASQWLAAVTPLLQASETTCGGSKAPLTSKTGGHGWWVLLVLDNSLIWCENRRRLQLNYALGF
jgi:hypothetical protein